MSLQMIKSLHGKDEYVLLPVNVYRLLKKQIDKVVEGDYVNFTLEDYVENPIALARIKANITQEELATYLNVSQAYISKIESKEKVPVKLMAKVKIILNKIKKLK